MYSVSKCQSRFYMKCPPTHNLRTRFLEDTGNIFITPTKIKCVDCIQQTFHLKNHLKNVTNTWKHTVKLPAKIFGIQLISFAKISKVIFSVKKICDNILGVKFFYFRTAQSSKKYSFPQLCFRKYWPISKYHKNF